MGTQQQILIVENEGLIADDLQSRLERLGYRVPAIAFSGSQALQVARTTRFDLVLMDIGLKGEMDGIEAAEILQHEIQIPIVFVTAHADADTVRRALAAEPFGFVLKPIVIEALRATIEIALRRSDVERRLSGSPQLVAAGTRLP
ncbi:MAG: response regulator [Acidobacteriia bacterium]|nr:response regulator [Terriglobia bacterium]